MAEVNSIVIDQGESKFSFEVDNLKEQSYFNSRPIENVRIKHVQCLVEMFLEDTKTREEESYRQIIFQNHTTKLCPFPNTRDFFDPVQLDIGTRLNYFEYNEHPETSSDWLKSIKAVEKMERKNSRLEKKNKKLLYDSKKGHRR